MLASPIPSSSPYNLNHNPNFTFDFDFQHQPTPTPQTPLHQPLASRSHNIPSPRSRRTVWRQQQPLMAKRGLRSGAHDHQNTFSDAFASKQPQHRSAVQTSAAFPLPSQIAQPTNTHAPTASTTSPPLTSQLSTTRPYQQPTTPQNPLTRTPSQRRNAQRITFLDSVSKRRENQIFESRGERMLHLQALEERKAWERECARVAAFQAGTVEGDDSTVEAEGLEGDVAVDAGVDAEALDDVLSTEEREMQELVAAHEEGDPFFASNAEAAFDEPCGEWMRYRRCVHGAGHCGYLESIAQQDARHEALDEVPLPRMDQSMDESGGGEVRGDGEEAASHWGSDDMDSSFEDELWRLGDSIGADDDGDKMDMS